MVLTRFATFWISLQTFLFSDCGGDPSFYILFLLLVHGIYGGALYIFQTQQQHQYIDLVGCWSGYMGAYKVSHIYFSTGYYGMK